LTYGSAGFKEAVAVLRKRMGDHMRSTDGFTGMAPVRREMEAFILQPTVDALLHLYDHLLFHEQWDAAVRLLAYCTPALVFDHPDVVDLTRKTLLKAEKFETPEMELAKIRLERGQELGAQFVGLYATSPRFRYWTSVARLTGAKSALEYGCDHGLHLFLAAHTFFSMQWFGVDPRPEVVEQHNARAASEGLTNLHFFVKDDPASLTIADCVGLLEVLEHTVHPDMLLDSVEACCRPGGIVVVSMPHDAWATHDGYGIGPDGGPGPGSHVASRHTLQLAVDLSVRGTIIHAQTLDGFDGEDERQTGCRSACVVYRPR